MGAERSQTGWLAIHAGILLAALWLISACLPQLAWPWYLLLPFIAYAVVVSAFAPLRQSSPRLHAGRIDVAGVVATLALSLAAVATLLAYQFLISPDVTALAAILPHALFGNLILAWILFSVLNALLEEIIFRGILYEALAAEWGTSVAIVGSAVLFGLGHLRGYPPGLMGAALAGIYGLALALLRWWTGGLVLAIGSHICADATIFGILAATGALEQSPA
jgi:membrane protease YdiL (CAAX protease family)